MIGRRVKQKIYDNKHNQINLKNDIRISYKYIHIVCVYVYIIILWNIYSSGRTNFSYVNNMNIDGKIIILLLLHNDNIYVWLGAFLYKCRI